MAAICGPPALIRYKTIGESVTLTSKVCSTILDSASVARIVIFDIAATPG